MSKPFQPGERLSAKRLNLHSAANAQVDLGTASGSMSRFGSSVANVQHDLAGRGIWVRVLPNSVREVVDTSGGGQRVVKSYGWEAIHLLDITESGKARKWARNPAVFGTKDVDPVFAADLGSLTPSEDGSLDYANASRPTLTPYLVARDPVSQRLIVVGGGGGSFSASGKDMVLMILGDYNAYKDCPGVLGVVGDPPKDENGNFCWPPYAWAAYKVCGYKYTKLFDMRGFGQWAQELNGGSTSSYRRFFPAFWGWDTYTDGYDPTGDANCAGVRFLGYNSQSALSCTCPTWLANVQCLKITVKFIAEVTCTDPNVDCDCDLDFWTNMSSLWGTEQTVILCNSQMGCAWQGDLTPFNLTLGWSSTPYDADENGNCSWGPSEFDPCYPCDGFSRMSLSINSNSVNGGGAGNVYDTFKVDVKTIRELIADCTKGPITLAHDTFKGHCPDGNTSVFEWVKVECCSAAEEATCV